AEPFRSSAMIGRRLAAIEAREGATPLLGSYQLPGIVYGLGHPLPALRSQADLLAHLEGQGKVVVALLPKQLTTLKDDPRVGVDACDTIEGFNIEKFHGDTIYLALISPRAAALAGEPRAAGAR